MTSSTYSPSLWVVSPICSPDILEWALMAAVRGSITRANINGERGHPCRVPFEIVKGSEVISDIHTLADWCEYRASIAVLMLPLNPNFWRKLR